ncbi:MAG: hypothetical protein LRY37_05350 [Alkalibacterium thalassium]|nr:hypothetical protein [Alkalibacterium thalassium]
MKSNRERLTEIASVLASYGFGHIYRTRVRTKHKEQDAANLRLALKSWGQVSSRSVRSYLQDRICFHQNTLRKCLN